MTNNKNNLKISLIIPAFNEENYIEECLRNAIKYSDGKFHEIIVIDNNSTDKTREIAEKFPGVRVVHEPQKGLTRARQKGLEVSTGEYIAYIDADTRLHPLWFKTAEDFFKKHPEVISLSGPYRYYDGSISKNFFQHITWWIGAPVNYYMAGYMVLGGNFIAKKEFLLKTGGFDKTIEFYGEDTDIARRLSKHGKVVFKMDFFIYSSSRRLQSEGFIKTNWIYGMNFLWQVLFHHPFTKEYTDKRLSNNLGGNNCIDNVEKNGAEIKAWVTSLFFALAFIITLVFESFDWQKAIPLAIFYAVFVFNTFFSIRCFSRIIPPYSFVQGIIDFILASLYIAVAINIDSPAYFIFFTLLIFAISSLKYTLLFGNIGYDSILKRKILIDMIGVCGCTLVIGGILIGYVRTSIWAWLVVFVIANIILFYFWPFYKIDILEDR
ncbi:MAG: glycosyltransferase family 2 protein [Minisyncoccia bacterium]